VFSLTGHIKKKIQDTNLRKYKFRSHTKNKDIISKINISKIKRGFICDKKELSDLNIYRKKVRNYTNIYKDLLLFNWDGNDYYDNEYIKNNYDLKYWDKNYPTVDHKISIIYGFKNNILPSIIGNLNNLCLTKRCINSSKKHKIEQDYIT